MITQLLWNDTVVCEVLPSRIHALPDAEDGRWHECVVVTQRRVNAMAGDEFRIRTSDAKQLPFIAARSRLGIEGWELVGKLLA